MNVVSQYYHCNKNRIQIVIARWAIIHSKILLICIDIVSWKEYILVLTWDIVWVEIKNKKEETVGIYTIKRENGFWPVLRICI